MFKNYKFDKKDPSNKHSFDIHDVDVSIVNGIRRTILTDIPTCGMIGEETPTVKIVKNNGSLHNEIMVHRVGLIPVCVSEDQLEEYEDGDIEITLNVLNEGIGLLNVSSGDIKGTLKGKDLTQKELSVLFPSNDVSKSHILITRLNKKDHLHFTASVVKRTARFNASFCPVSLSNFYYLEDPVKSKKATNLLDKERSYYTNEYGEARVCKFEIEPINKNVGPRYLVNKAIEIVIDKLNKLIGNLQNGDIQVYQFQVLEHTYDFQIQDEDDTIGNIIQSYMHNKYVRGDNDAPKAERVSYIGYICPHPLKSELIIRLTIDDETDVNRFVKCLAENCKSIIEKLLDMKKEWNAFTK